MRTITPKLALLFFAACLVLKTPAATLYVDINGTSPTPPYSDWSTAAISIQDAIDTANDGDLILVNDGTYSTGGRVVDGSLTNRVVIDKAVTVQSVDGPGATVIQGNPDPDTTVGSNSVRCIYLASNAVLSGFTLTQGATRDGGDGNTEQSGGGAFCQSTNTVITNCVFTSNNANVSGGAVASGLLYNCTVFGNNSFGDGGGTVAGILKDRTVSGNQATYEGGGTTGGALYGCTVVNNFSGINGGGMYGGYAEGCTLTANTATGAGGAAIYSTLTNCVLSGNSVGFDSAGGGAYGSELDRCLVIGNMATQDFSEGGGVEFCTVNDSIIASNSAAAFGGGAMGGTLNNCTIVGNSASGSGGGAGDASLNNCIIYYNSAPTDSSFTLNGEVGGTLNYCCIADPAPDGTGNFTNAPQFVNPADGDYHLQITSPCIDAGNNSYVTLDADFDGNPRIVGASVDVGAFEFHKTTPLHPSIQVTFTNIATGYGLSLASSVQVGEVAVTSSWNFGDGTVVSNQTQVVHAWSAPGDYLVTYTAFNDSNPSGVYITQAIHVVAANYYVALDSSNPVYPYLSWNTAASNIQDAVDAAGVGGTIWVSNGVYAVGGRVVYGALTNRLAVSKPANIVSINGPQFTVIQGFLTNDDTTCVRCLYLTNGVTFAGFTLTDGETRNGGGDLILENCGGGAWCESNNVVISNCVFSANIAAWAGGGCYQGTLINCAFTNNYGYFGGAVSTGNLVDSTLTGNFGYDGGAAGSSTLLRCAIINNATYIDSDYTANGGGLSGCSATNCTIAGNYSITGGGASSCTLVNCFLSGNSSGGGGGVITGSGGGGAVASTLVNCTVVGNTAAEGGGLLSCNATNCIIYFNSAPSDTNYSPDSVLSYCDAPTLPASGTGNITGNPQFADPIHIGPTSPCRAAGLAAVVNGMDIDGEPWLNPPSIGCDQFDAASATGALSVAISEPYTNVSTGFLDDFTAQVSGHALSNNWDFGDGSTADNQLSLKHSWSAAGNYTVTFTVYNNDHPSGVSASVVIFVLSTPVHYVVQSNATPVAPYLSWATAATNIQDAVDAAFAGGTITVSNGIYQTGSTILYGSKTNRVAVTRPLTIQSVNGSAVTVIDGGNAVRCLYLTNRVSVTGFTLQNGQEINGAGVYCEGDDVLNNCVLSGNASPANGSTGGGAYGGTLNHCLLTGNQANYQGSGAFNSALNFCLVSNNLFTTYGSGACGGTMSDSIVISNTATWGGGLAYTVVSNSLVLDNLAYFGGGGSYFGTFYNCTIVKNTGPTGLGADSGGVLGDTLNNSICYYNNGGNYGAEYGVSLSHSCTTPDPYGQLTVTNEPLFVDLANGDFHLQSNSPCINSGDNSLAAGPHDYDGLPRIKGDTVDIGMFEYQTPSSILSYAWAQQYGISTDGSADNADPDGDGMLNWQESIARTDPTSASSKLQMQTIFANTGSGPGVINVTWQSVNGVNYFVERSSDLSGGFSLIQDNIYGQAGSTTWEDSTATNDVPYFYRVGVH